MAVNLEIGEKEPGQSIRQWGYGILRSNIIKMHLKPGLAISESEIAAELNASRTPIREAFIKLVEDGLLETYPQKGSFVSLIDIEQAEEARFVRKVLETAITKAACEHFDEDCLFDLSANVEMQKFCSKRGNYERMFDLDNEFHRIIYRGCGKERTWLHIGKMAYNYNRLRILHLSATSWDEVIYEHSEIARLIEEHNVAVAHEIVGKYLSTALLGDLAVAVKHPEYFKQNIQDYV